MKEMREMAEDLFKKNEQAEADFQSGKMDSTFGEGALEASLRELRDESKRAVKTPFGRFDSYNNAEKNIPGFLAHKLKELPHLYYYEDQGPGEVTYETVYYSPCGCSNKRVDVYRFCKEAKMPSALENSHVAHWWKKMCRFYPDIFYTKEEPKQEWALKGILRNTNKKKK